MRVWLILALLVQAWPATAQDVPSAPADPRLLTLAYDPGQVVRLQVAPNHQLTLIFSSDERVENVAVGDSEAWQVTLNQRGDALFLKPLRRTSPTNMTVITDARIYNFELTSVAAASFDTPFTIRFVHPEPAADTIEAAEPPTLRRYRFRGSRALHPEAMSDDGVRTYIEWRDRQAIPAVFALDAAGGELLLTGHMRDDRYVIDAVHETLIFRLQRQSARAERLAEGARR